MTHKERESTEHKVSEFPFTVYNFKVALVMPVYNEGETIRATVLEIEEKILSKMPNTRLFIFEDGSNDNTKEVLASLADRQNRIFVSMTSSRKGYPRAVKEALLSINENEFEYILFLDSDGQYDPDDFVKLFDTALREPVDMIVGCRVNRVEPIYRRVLSYGLRILEKLLFGPSCKDVTSALRLMRVNVAKRIASKMKYSKYNFWLEFTARAAEEGLSIKEVPVNYRVRAGGTMSRVYSIRKMPKVVYTELRALLRTWWEYNGIQALKFAGVGLSGALVILGLSYLLTSVLGQNYLLSTAIAIETSIVWAFILNDKLTFNRAHRSFRIYERMARYNLVSLGGLGINETILFCLVNFAKMYYLLSEFIAIVITFGFNYLASLKWTWVKQTTTATLPLSAQDRHV